jgi:ATP-binding cassette, subfamily B, bacterial
MVEPMSNDRQTLTQKLCDGAAQCVYVQKFLHLVWTASHGWTAAWGILLVAQGLLPVTTVYLTRLLVDSLVAAMHAGAAWQSIQHTLGLAVLMAGIVLLMEFLQGTSDWVRTFQSELVQDHISALVHEKSTSVDLAFYESPEYHDRLHRARNEASTRPLALLENAGALFQTSLTLLAMTAILIPYSAWLPVILLVSTLPALFAVLHSNQRYHQWWTQTTTDRRQAQYYDVMLTHSTVAAELRLFGLGAHFQAAYQSIRRRLRTERLELLKRQSLARLGAGAFALLISGAAMGWMVWRALQGLATLGDLALFYQAFHVGQGLLRSLLGSVGQIYTSSLFLGNLFEFLELQSEVTDPAAPIPVPQPLQKAIHFRQVRFTYPASIRPALSDFNLTIPAGKVVAIVGPNGAGKSTLVKLLCRFYDPQAGCIQFDGVDLRALSISKLRRLITVLFQWPVPYHGTAAQNIAYGDLTAASTAADIETAARAAGAHETITRLPRGYDTLLGKGFAHGVELSAGEWQRVALARAFLRRAPIILLDEPTSFMDSWAEADWFERFRMLATGRTAIIITHRFTIAMRADIIHVMDNGRIVESGNHQELLDLGGLYARSWAAQLQASSGVCHPYRPHLETPPRAVTLQTYGGS